MNHVPPHIIEGIISYTVKRDRLSPGLQSTIWPRAVPRVLFPLMGVCREWRYVAKWFLGESASIFINPRKLTLKDKSEYVHTLEDIIAFGLEQRVRHLLLACHIVDIADGTAYSAVGSLFAQCKGKLRNVHTVTLSISVGRSHYQYNRYASRLPRFSPRALASLENEFCLNVSRVGELLKEAMPNIVSVLYYGDEDSMLNKQRINTPALSAFLGAAPLVQYLSIHCGELSYTALESWLAPNVKHMHVYLSDDGSSGSAELAIRYADHLETLSVDTTEYESFRKLFKSPTGELPVVYSQLRTFKTSSYICGIRNDNSYTLQANPFPELRRLICKEIYPFPTSLVLRWIQPTVEVVRVTLYGEAYERFVRDGVFSAGSFPNLRYMDLTWDVTENEHLYVDPICDLRRLLSLSPVLEKGIFKVRVARPNRTMAALYKCGYEVDLNIAGVEFTIAEAIQLISKFPELQSMAVILKDNGDANEQGHISDADIEVLQQKNMPPVSARLTRLCIAVVNFTSCSYTALHILLLASIFKSIKRIEIDSIGSKPNCEILATFDKAKECRYFNRGAQDRVRCMEARLSGNRIYLDFEFDEANQI